MTSRRVRTPPGSCTSSVVTQKTGPRYTVREEINFALGRELDCLDLAGVDLIRGDLGMRTI